MAEVFASEYNSLRSRINAVMVTDYGQTLNATTDVIGDYVTNTTSTDFIEATQWNNLYIDMIRARTHQDSSFTQQALWVGDYVTNTTNTDEVAQVDLNYLSSLMTDIETNNRVLDVANQSSITTIATSTRTAQWNNFIQHEFTVTFASSAAKDNFFKAGGEIRFNASITYSGTESKTLDWQSLLSGMGNIKMNYTETVSSNSVGTGSTLGGLDLTATYQLLYQRYAATYTTNNYRVYGRADSATVLRFLVELEDAATGNIDENVLGTVTSNGQAVTPDGSVTIGGTAYDTVVLSAPTASNIVLLTAGGGPPATYSLTPTSTSVNEGSSVTFTATTTNVPDGTTLYWTVDGTTADFTAVSGSFTINSNTGTFDISAIADSLTEGAENYTVSIRTGSISGTVVDTSTLTVNDTSLSVFTFTISSNTSDANLATLATSAGWNGTDEVQATIGTGVYVSASSTANAGLVVSGTFTNGVSLTNNGFIVGMGGAGGNAVSGAAGNPGAAGGTGLSVSTAITIDNTNGTIAGGGGGGGAGGNGQSGGGGGRTGQTQSAGGTGASSNGANGTATSAGIGGTTLPVGGDGGNWGSNGAAGGGTGGKNNIPGGAGGAAGAAITGNSNITWTATGTRLGAIT